MLKSRVRKKTLPTLPSLRLVGTHAVTTLHPTGMQVPPPV
jgi:hypothetical protein